MRSLTSSPYKINRRSLKTDRIPFDQDPVYHYPLPSLCDFLETSSGYYWFGECLREKHCEENLTFYQEVNRYSRLLLDNDRKIRAKEIYEEFIEEGSSGTLINLPISIACIISHKIRGMTKSSSGTVFNIFVEGTCDANVFNDAREHILGLMFMEYINFRMTEFFASWLNDKGENPSKLRKKWRRSHDGKGKDLCHSLRIQTKTPDSRDPFDIYLERLESPLLLKTKISITNY
eukprot:TRINITY_DN13244_c0_g2_i2.p1 TRINITY_DN13244_c0_g2~~TRINITY_DN13244_c0_g2_i2.p1  ORF type:complete len:233 (-),score=18.12 TRINITY_DN13244_c0_g2_i2:317-1015(-)